VPLPIRADKGDNALEYPYRMVAGGHRWRVYRQRRGDYRRVSENVTKMKQKKML
jgi:hypothetical protein